MSSPTPIKISLLNTMTEWVKQKERKPLPREEQIVQVNQTLVQELLSCQVSSESAEEAIAILRNEITTGLESGKYPRDFPRWKKALIQLQQVERQNGPESHFCEFEKNRKMTETLPSYLVSLYLKTDHRVLGEQALGDAMYEPTQLTYLPLGKVSVSQGLQKLEFSLTCRDYAGIYAESVPHQKDTAVATVSSRRVKNLVPENFPDTIEGANNIGSFLSLLQMNDDKSKNLYTRFIEISRQKNYGPRNASPEQVNALLADLAIEPSLTASQCAQNIKDDYDSNNVKYRDTNCLLLKMNSLGRSYIVYFIYDMEAPLDSQVPRLDFVQITPTVQ